MNSGENGIGMMKYPTPLLKKIQLEHDAWLICEGCVRKIVHGLGFGHDYKTSINCLTIVP